MKSCRPDAEGTSLPLQRTDMLEADMKSAGMFFAESSAVSPTRATAGAPSKSAFLKYSAFSPCRESPVAGLRFFQSAKLCMPRLSGARTYFACRTFMPFPARAVIPSSGVTGVFGDEPV